MKHETTHDLAAYLPFTQRFLRWAWTITGSLPVWRTFFYIQNEIYVEERNET